MARAMAGELTNLTSFNNTLPGREWVLRYGLLIDAFIHKMKDNLGSLPPSPSKGALTFTYHIRGQETSLPRPAITRGREPSPTAALCKVQFYFKNCETHQSLGILILLVCSLAVTSAQFYGLATWSVSQRGDMKASLRTSNDRVLPSDGREPRNRGACDRLRAAPSWLLVLWLYKDKQGMGFTRPEPTTAARSVPRQGEDPVTCCGQGLETSFLTKTLRAIFELVSWVGAEMETHLL